MDTMDSSRITRLVLLAQGSQDPRWQKPFVSLHQKLVSEFGKSRVTLAYLEKTRPSLQEVAEAAAGDGITDITILPLFLALGDDTEQDIPRQVVQIKEQFPSLGVVLLPPIGEHPTVAEAIYTVARASAQ